MWLHGPWHMILSYRFAPPQQGAASNTWTLSVEGDKSTFPADVGYSLQSPITNHHSTFADGPEFAAATPDS